MAGIVVMTGAPAFEADLRAAVGAEATVVRWPEDDLRLDAEKLVAEITDARPDAVVLGPGLDLDMALDLAAAFNRDGSGVSVVMTADPAGTLWQRALRAGVQEIIPPGAAPDDLALVVNRAVEMGALRRERNAPSSSEPEQHRRVVSILSPKGGSGKTTIATNMAVALARVMKGRVALVDLDLQFGDVSSALQVDAVHTVADATRTGEQLDSTKLKVFLAPHSSSLFALCAPETPAEADDIGAADVGHILGLLAEDFPVVVADTAAGLGEHALSAIDASTDLVFACSMDVASVRALRKEIDALDRLGVVTAKRHLVINRADSRVGLTAHDIESVLGLHVDASLPSSREVPLSMNEGIPLVESNPKAPVSRAVTAFAERFVTLSELTKQEPSPVRGLRLFRKEAS